MWICLWERHSNSERMDKSILILIPKIGDLKKCENYRTISLINYSSKISPSVLLQRPRSEIKSHLSEEQAGFRKDHNTIQQILCLWLIAEKQREVNRGVFNCFVDFKKAFDLVWHEGLWSVLKSFNHIYLRTNYIIIFRLFFAIVVHPAFNHS